MIKPKQPFKIGVDEYYEKYGRIKSGKSLEEILGCQIITKEKFDKWVVEQKENAK